MKGLELTLDGVKYFVTAKADTCGHVDLNLYLGSMRGNVIYTEVIPPMDVNKFDVKKAKKFILRSFEKK